MGKPGRKFRNQSANIWAKHSRIKIDDFTEKFGRECFAPTMGKPGRKFRNQSANIWAKHSRIKIDDFTEKFGRECFAPTIDNLKKYGRSIRG
ncbi:hypothetical protein H6G72_05080 [Planktothricoides sp. FACHB-1370]|uniref:Uncharacterized protein n=1 Tax=Planktothricoides raciborskii FACHB-1370 TaxID=2949576 RepID=A0ABR8E9J4_9CYAN|nr:hypothetical protein [Planktothricoides raciborskii FACHB-1370]